MGLYGNTFIHDENIDEFDVREYFVQLVSKLKQQGL